MRPHRNQRAGVERFSAATKDFAGVSSAEFVKSRTDVIEMNTMRMELRDDTVTLERLDEHFTVDRVAERLRASRRCRTTRISCRPW